jgi:hypothetical protein
VRISCVSPVKTGIKKTGGENSFFASACGLWRRACVSPVACGIGGGGGIGGGLWPVPCLCGLCYVVAACAFSVSPVAVACVAAVAFRHLCRLCGVCRFCYGQSYLFITRLLW